MLSWTVLYHQYQFVAGCQFVARAVASGHAVRCRHNTVSYGSDRSLSSLWTKLGPALQFPRISQVADKDAELDPRVYFVSSSRLMR